MVKSLTVNCPHCHQVSDIYLSTNACVIVLNCPTCMSPIMYFENKIFLLSEKQVDAIKDTTHNSAIMRMLDRIAHPEIPVEKAAKTVAHAHNSHACKSESVHTSVAQTEFKKGGGVKKRECDICDDDVTNLKIELALCNDSLEFINRL